MQEENRKKTHDGLDEYIRVNSPGLTVIIGALSLILVATIIWGFTGKIPVTASVTGCVVDSTLAAEAAKLTDGATDDQANKAWVVCFLDSSKYSAEQISRFDDDVTISMPDHTTFKGKIVTLSPHPIDRDEAGQYLQDGQWVADQCVNSDYSWGVAIRVSDDMSSHMYTTPQVTIITDEVPPIRFLTR